MNSQKKTVSGHAASGLETPIQYCPSVGPKRAILFGKMDVQTVRDLFWHLPRGYEDHHTITPIRDLYDGQIATVTADVISVESREPRNPGHVRHILNTQVKDETGFLSLVWFNQAYLQDKVRSGARLLLHGKVERDGMFLKMSAPQIEVLADKTEPGDTPAIVPLYPLTEGLTHKIIRIAIQKARERFGKECREFLPQEILKEYDFPLRPEAFRRLHAPQLGEGAPTGVSSDQPELFDWNAEQDSGEIFTSPGTDGSPWEKARQRLVFEEFFLHQFLLRRFNGKRRMEPGIAHIPPDPDPWASESVTLDPQNPRCWPAWFIQHLPFPMTPDQMNVCREIERDMISPQPMSRLLQGDVGSGKTVVSIYAMLVAVAGGWQAAMMVPTEILARQHAATFHRLTQSIPGLNLAVLRGSAKTRERKEMLEAAASGNAQIIIGTHALFQEQVEFSRLGLVVVDEQHKFGVDQRQRLIEKGQHPDLLVATATPIPRTLSLTLYGDMDISVIRSLPPGRPPVTTRWTTWEKEKQVWRFVDEKIALGQQVYVVCPIIEPSENMPQLPSTEEAFEKLSETFLPHRRLARLHGRHSAEDKEDLMARMQAGEIDVVVATTVIEVGVDLPNATIMVVLGAERFGLAQLHQLRGRVGRGTQKSYCILITHPRIAPYAQERMRVMEKTRDGFVIAEQDLRLRGPGEQFGTRQSGHLNFRLADPLHDTLLLHEAHHAAEHLYETDPDLQLPEHAGLIHELKIAFNRLNIFRPS